MQAEFLVLRDHRSDHTANSIAAFEQSRGILLSEVVTFGSGANPVFGFLELAVGVAVRGRLKPAR